MEMVKAASPRPGGPPELPGACFPSRRPLGLVPSCVSETKQGAQVPVLTAHSPGDPAGAQLTRIHWTGWPCDLGRGPDTVWASFPLLSDREVSFLVGDDLALSAGTSKQQQRPAGGFARREGGRGGEVEVTSWPGGRLPVSATLQQRRTFGGHGHPRQREEGG